MWTMEHIEIDISVLDELGNIKSIPDRFCGLCGLKLGQIT